MKKVLALLMMVLLVLNFSAVSFAKVGGFVSSPSASQSPTVESFKPEDEDCSGKLVITAYGNRDQLPEDVRAVFEAAYKDIAGASDLTKLSADLAKIVSNNNIKASNLAVSDLFNLHATDCDAHADHYDFDITVSGETLNKFVALLQMNADGTWEVVKGAQVVSDGKHLKFTVKSLSTLAIVINTEASGPVAPPTSDNWMIYVYGGIAVASAAALVVTWIFWRKSRKEDNA